MLETILYLAAAWIIIGLVVAALIYLDQSDSGEKNLIWPVIGFVLSLIGLLIYYLLIMRKRGPRGPEYPAKPQYGVPDYVFEKEESAPTAPGAKKEEGKVQQLEGAPRCDNCGAAISVHDLKCPNCGKQLR